MTSGQHVGCECSFCVTVTRAIPGYHVCKQGFRQLEVGVPSSPMIMWSVANFDTPPALSSVDARFETVSVSTRVVRLLTHAANQARFHESRVVLPQIPRTLARSPSASWLHLSQSLFLLMCRPSASTQPAGSMSIRLPVTSLQIVPCETRCCLCQPRLGRDLEITPTR